MILSLQSTTGATAFEIDELHNPEATLVIRRIKAHFARHGVPDEVVTDDGPQYTSALFDKLAKEWMFQYTQTSPHYPQANGMAESTVKTAKKLITTAAESNSDTWSAVSAQRNTPTEGMTTRPARRLFCRQTKGLLPLAAKQVEHNTATIQADKTNLNKDRNKVVICTTEERTICRS